MQIFNNLELKKKNIYKHRKIRKIRKTQKSKEIASKDRDKIPNDVKIFINPKRLGKEKNMKNISRSRDLLI